MTSDTNIEMKITTAYLTACMSPESWGVSIPRNADGVLDTLRRVGEEYGLEEVKTHGYADCSDPFAMVPAGAEAMIRWGHTPNVMLADSPVTYEIDWFSDYCACKGRLAKFEKLLRARLGRHADEN